MSQSEVERPLQQAILADQILLSEHLERLLATPIAASQRDNIRSFQLLLGAHHLAIEEVLYPALVASDAPAEALEMAQAAHEVCEHCANEALLAAGSQLEISRPHLLALKSLWSHWPAGREALSLRLASERLSAEALLGLACSYRDRLAELSEELASIG